MRNGISNVDDNGGRKREREIRDLDNMVILVQGVAVGAESGARAIEAVQIAFVLGQFGVHGA